VSEATLPMPEAPRPVPQEEAEEGGVRYTISQLRNWRERIINSLLMATAVLGLVAVLAEGAMLSMRGRWDVLAVIVVAYAVALLLALVHRIPFRVRAAGFLVLFYLVSLFDLMQSGLSGDGRVFLLAFPLLALILLGKRVGAISLALSLVTLAAAGWAMATGRHAPSFEALSSDPLSWVTGTAIYLLLAVAVFIPSSYLIANLVTNLSRALEEARRRWREVHQLTYDLEHQVAERTADLAATAEVARQTASLTDEQELIERFVRLVAERFGLYHVGLFLLDDQGEHAVLRAASSVGGQRMVERSHRVWIGSDDPVGQAVRVTEARPLIVPGVPSPDLPETRWRAAIPLRVGGRTIGALDVHFSEEQYPPEERTRHLQTLADQLAVGLENARLFGQTRSNLEELAALHRTLTVESWERFAQARPELSRYRVGETDVPDEAWQALFAQARHLGRSVTSFFEGEDGGRHLLAVPVRLRGVPIGVVGFHRAAEAGEWLTEEIAVAEGVAERMALALENVRLLGEARRRAARERFVREITGRIQEATDIESLVRVAAEELNQALGGSRAYVRLTTEELIGG